MAIDITNLETVLNEKLDTQNLSVTTPDKDLLLLSKSVEAIESLNGLKTTDIGTSVQGYDSTILNEANIDVNVQRRDDRLDEVAALTPTIGNFIVGDGAGFVAKNSATARTSLGLTIGTDVGYLNIPKLGSTKTAAYTLALTDIGELIEVGASGSITIPDSTFSTGDVILIFNNTSGVITLTCSIPTAYIGGTDTDKATIDVAPRGICNVLFISPSVCVITGNVA